MFTLWPGSGERVRMLGPYVKEVDVDAIDVCNELREGVKFCFHFAPVILCRPIVRKRFHRVELEALGQVGDYLISRWAGRKL
jgi:hypothetical protein